MNPLPGSNRKLVGETVAVVLALLLVVATLLVPPVSIMSLAGGLEMLMVVFAPRPLSFSSFAPSVLSSVVGPVLAQVLA